MGSVIATNKKAFRDYTVLERFEAGIELKGSEVKSLRDAKISINDSFCRVEGGQVFCITRILIPIRRQAT